MTDFVVEHTRRPAIGFRSRGRVITLAAKRGLDAKSPGCDSGPVVMFDGSWGYWTAHDIKSHDGGVLGRADEKMRHSGLVLLRGGRVIKGHDWARWETSFGCDLKHPTIWTSMGCSTPWKYQVDLYGNLTDHLP